MSAVSDFTAALKRRHMGTDSPADVQAFEAKDVRRAERIILFVEDLGFEPTSPYDTRPNHSNIRELARITAWKSCTDAALEGALTAVKDLLIAEAAYLSVYNAAGVVRAGYGRCAITPVKSKNGNTQAHGALDIHFDVGITDSEYTPLDEVSVVTAPITRIRSFGDIAFEKSIV